MGLRDAEGSGEVEGCGRRAHGTWGYVGGMPLHANLCVVFWAGLESRSDYSCEEVSLTVELPEG